MEEKPVIRPAREDDCERLGELKYNYIRQIYSSITPRQVLDDSTRAVCEERVRTLLHTENLAVDVVELDGEICGFAAYGPDPDAPGWGLLYDTLYLTHSSIDLHHALLRRIVDQLSAKGMERIHLWTLRNHYRARYLYELFGFRTDGVQLCHKVNDNEYKLIRYQYPVV